MYRAGRRLFGWIIGRSDVTSHNRISLFHYIGLITKFIETIFPRHETCSDYNKWVAMTYSKSENTIVCNRPSTSE